MSEYTAYDFNDPLGSCAKQADIRKDLDFDSTYDGFGFAHQTIFYKNMTKEWNNIRFYDVTDCDRYEQIIIGLAAFYMANYDCNFKNGKISCDFGNGKSWLLSEVFNSYCFDDLQEG